MSNYDRNGYYVGLAGLAVGIIGILFGYFAIQASWKIAEDSGSLDKPEFEVGIAGNPLTPNKQNTVIVGASELASSNSSVLGFIPFTFYSTGKKAIDSMDITFQYHSMFRREILESSLEMKRYGNFSATELKKSFMTSGDQSFVAYRIPSMNPGTKASIKEPFNLQETRLVDNISVTAKDGTQLSMPYELSYALKFTLSVNGRENEPRNYPILLSMEKAQSMNALKTGRFKNHLETSRQQLRKQLGFLSYLAALATSSPKGQVLLVYIPLQSASVKDAIVYYPKGNQEVVTATYPLLSWNLLLSNQ